MDLQQQLKSKLDKRKYLYLFLDFEGTIIPKSESQLQPRPRQQVIKALEKLQEIQKVSVNLLSERSIQYVRDLIQVENFNYIGYLGGEIQQNSHPSYVFNPEIYKKLFKDIKKQYDLFFENLPGIEFRETPFYINLNYGQNHSPSFFHAFNLWLKEIYPKIIRYRLMPVFYHNNKFILKPAKLNKINAVHKILEEKDLHKSIVIYVGDNFMDEEIFTMFKDKGITIRIDNYTAKTTAHHHFRSDIELIRFLNMIFDFYV
ncbi:MAG: HAD-IIB family hydrolase [Calditrichia bacterium]|nr:HAD-IIB family hydrolase [Calditrichia bacterium]